MPNQFPFQSRIFIQLEQFIMVQKPCSIRMRGANCLKNANLTVSLSTNTRFLELKKKWIPY